jgi:hypothetical protein
MRWAMHARHSDALRSASATADATWWSANTSGLQRKRRHHRRQLGEIHGLGDVALEGMVSITSEATWKIATVAAGVTVIGSSFPKGSSRSSDAC